MEQDIALSFQVVGRTRLLVAFTEGCQKKFEKED